jgi:hypothetical protein
MPYSCASLFFLLLFTASASAQGIGVVRCLPGSAARVPAFIAPGNPNVVAQLTCGQTVRVLGVDKSVSPLSYSSRPAEYLIIQLDEKLGYVDSGSIQVMKSDEPPDAKKVEKSVPAKEISPQEEERQKWSRVSTDSIRVRDVGLSTPIIINGSTYMRNFRAVLTNKSAFPISQLDLRLRIYDCTGETRSDYSNCEIVGEAKSTASISVPAGQTRLIEVPTTFGEIPHVRNTMVWNYQILGVRTE